MSDTPRTDMHQNLSRGLMNPTGQAWEFARTLERQMVKARADTRKATLKEIIKMYQEYFPTNDDAEWLDIYRFSEMLKHKLEGEDE